LPDRPAQPRIARGDLAAAWDDVVLLLRMAHQVGQGALGWEAFTAQTIERVALDLAIDWANAKGQSPDRLRGAIGAYLSLPRMIPPSEVIRAEGVVVERTVDLTRQELKDFLVESMSEGSGRVPTFDRFLLVDLMTTPWELARVRRLNRLFTARGLEFATLEPWQRRNQGYDLTSDIYGQVGQADRLAFLRLLQFNFAALISRADENEAMRRGLVQVMAMRSWLLGHDGKFPAKLEDLVPSELPALPLDPFMGKPFDYTTLARSLELRSRPQDWHPPAWPSETRLIYSTGPDGRDDQGLFIVPGQTNGNGNDLVFPVEPVATKK
ncbi:MAG: hypothetical protein ACYC61_23835, partial [Isosphaeraceae bacterium]